MAHGASNKVTLSGEFEFLLCQTIKFLLEIAGAMLVCSVRFLEGFRVVSGKLSVILEVRECFRNHREDQGGY